MLLLLRAGSFWPFVCGCPGEARHFKRQGAFFYCPAGFQSARHGAAACARSQLQRSGQCRAHCVRGSAAFFVLLSFRERQCSETDSHFAAGHICRMHFCGYKKPFAMAHGLPGASQKSPGTLLRPFSGGRAKLFAMSGRIFRHLSKQKQRGNLAEHRGGLHPGDFVAEQKAGVL